MIEQHFPDVCEKDIEKACTQALKLGELSTQVNGWYESTYYDNRAGGRMTIRGPFCRWFWLDEGNDDDRNGNSQGCLAAPENDILFASYALNNIRSISTACLKLFKFKEYVHGRLDAAQVPEDPEPAKNAAHGCRVEGRLNWLIAKKDESEKLKAMLKRANSYLREGKAKFAPHTKNSLVDEWLADYAALKIESKE